LGVAVIMRTGDFTMTLSRHLSDAEDLVRDITQWQTRMVGRDLTDRTWRFVQICKESLNQQFIDNLRSPFQPKDSLGSFDIPSQLVRLAHPPGADKKSLSLYALLNTRINTGDSVETIGTLIDQHCNNLRPFGATSTRKFVGRYQECVHGILHSNKADQQPSESKESAGGLDANGAAEHPPIATAKRQTVAHVVRVDRSLETAETIVLGGMWVYQLNEDDRVKVEVVRSLLKLPDRARNILQEEKASRGTEQDILASVGRVLNDVVASLVKQELFLVDHPMHVHDKRVHDRCLELLNCYCGPDRVMSRSMEQKIQKLRSILISELTRKFNMVIKKQASRMRPISIAPMPCRPTFNGNSGEDESPGQGVGNKDL
jgi:hypothetical protein